MNRPKGLGRGLDALLGSAEKTPDRTAELALDRIQPGRYQPRSRMDEQALVELAASIRAQGLMQPLLVRPVGDDRFEIIAGERRWRAARMAGLDRVPVLVREVPDNAALAMALIENIQREDLSAMEQATGIARLIDEFKMTHDQAADAVGRSRPATSNLLRLLRLSKPVQAHLMNGGLEMGHARALLALEGARQVETANRVVAKGLSVRQTEVLVKSLGRTAKSRRSVRTDRDVANLEEELSGRLGTTVQIRPARKGTGTLSIRYASLEHLDRLLDLLRKA